MKKLSLLLAFALGFVLSGCGSGSPTPPMITFTPTGAQAIDQGQSLNLTTAVSNDATSKGVTWTLAGTTCTGAACGTLSNVTTTSVTYTPPALAAAVRAPLASSPSASHSSQHTNQAAVSTSLVVTITATLVADPTKSNSVMVTVTLPPTITTTVLPAGTEGTPYNQTVASSGGAGTLTFTISAGALPGGLTLSSAGVISGTPTGPNTTASFTVKATDSSTVSPQSVTQALSIAINLPPAPSITTTTLPNGVQGTPYSQTISATAGLAPYSFTFTGTLPAGLTLSSAGVISGTPTAFGTANFTVKVTDSSNPAQTATQPLSIKINAAPVSITTTSLPNGVVNAGYNATLQASGGAPPLTWSLAAGSALPTGLLLSSTGAITGTPTTAGTTNFTVQAADSSVPQQTATKALSITVNPVLSITTPSLPNGVTNTAYSATLVSSGGVNPVTWSVTGGALPTGLTLNASTGAITGSPTAAGPFNFTVQAADSGTPQQKVTKALSITIVQQLAITNTTLPTGSVTSLYAVTLQTSGGTPTVSWAMTLGSLPPGLNLNSATGAISGTPTTAAGSPFTFTVQATDSGTPQQIVTKQFTIVINPVLAITTASPMPSGTVGTAYSQAVQTDGGGIAPITWSITLGALPGGLSLNTTNGAITGTPNAAGTFNFTVKAADSGTPQQTSSKALTIQISTAPLSVATTGLPDGVVGQSYNNAILQSAGGNPPVTWSIVGTGTLPAGLTLTSTGAITGTPTTAGTSTFTVKATDSTSPTAQTATKQLSIRVNTVLSVTTTTLPNGIVNNSYSTTLQSSGGATPITWSITAGSLPPGLTLVQSTGVISGTPNTTTGSPFSFTVQAADSTSPTAQTASANLSITVTVAPLVITTTSLPSGLINSNYNQTLNVTGGTNPVTWALTGGTLLPAGLVLNPANGNISGTPTTAGTSNFTVKATDSTTPTAQTATANLSITINSAACNTGSESLLKGNYAFVLKGFDNGAGAGETSPQPVLVGGVLTLNGTPNGGLITSGTIDINGNSTANATSGVLTNTVTSGTYSVGSDHRGCMAITTSAGTQNYRFSLGNISAGVASTGHVIAFDANGPFTSGVLRKQDTNAFSISVVIGNYAFGVSSAQNTANGGGKFAAAGVLNFVSGGVVNGGEVDFNTNGSPDNGTPGTSFPASPVSILSGTYTINAADGRGTLIFTPSGSTSPVKAVLYVVSATDVLILGSDDQTANSAFAGEAMRQSNTAFTANPLSGAYIGYQSGLSTNPATAGASRATLLLLNASGTGISGSQLRNDGGTFQAKNLTGITYSVDPTGRMTITGGTQQPVFYLVSANQAFELSADASVDSGFFQSQTGSSFTNASLNGLFAFGTVDPEDANGGANSGTATFTPATTTISLIEDKSGNGSLNADQTQSFSYSIDPTTGLVHIPSGCTISATPTTCQTVLLVVSPTKAVILDTSSTNPKIQVADQ
ncbi:MAG TPA: putative Ig domain-containing protein [Candidatus Dormibacteraeota bacterium]|nr:putative Ig domain-containing protein [Candidatus Dormibacteraeota bacterium]